MKLYAWYFLMLAVIPGTLLAQDTHTYTVSNPYPFTECTYQVTAHALVVDVRGSLAVELEPISEVIKPGDSKEILIDVPEGQRLYEVTFTAVASSSGTLHVALGEEFEVRQDGCLTERNARTFWKPIGEQRYEIWEALVTEEIEEEVESGSNSDNR